MARLIAERNVPVVLMHNRDSADAAIDIMKDIADYFARSLEIADKAGIARENIVLDPGIGFGKTPEQSMTRWRGLASSARSASPSWSAPRASVSSPPSPRRSRQQRLGGSIAAHLIAVRNGAKIIRAHDVAETVQALRVTAAIEDLQ